jgi:GntR family transcriptional regulator
MEFQAQMAIWQQIAHQIASRIIAGEWPPGERIPSVRDLGAALQVNPNTVVRAVTHLQDMGIVSNQRGVGYFVTPDGVQKAQQLRKAAFTQDLLPKLFHLMDELGMNWDEIQTLYQQHKQPS